MSDGRLARWSPVGGLLFVALFLTAAGLVADVPGAGSSDAKIRSYYGDNGNQVKLQIAYFVMTLATVFFLWFLGFFAGRLRQMGPGSAWLSWVVVASGTAAVLLMLAGFAADSAVAATANHTSRFHIDPDTARVITDFAYALTFETGLPLAAPLVLAGTLALRRAGRIGPRLAWAGYVVAATCIVGLLGVPMALFLAWVLGVCVLLLRRPLVATAAEAP